MNEIILMAHVLFGVGCIVTSVWIFVDVIHASDLNRSRIVMMSWAASISMWLSFIIAGYWYVTFYKIDKAIILKGPWPFAHNFVMETKEHLVIMLLLLATYLPIVAASDHSLNKSAKRIMLWVTALIAVLGLMIEGQGALIETGVKVALLSKQH